MSTNVLYVDISCTCSKWAGGLRLYFAFSSCHPHLLFCSYFGLFDPASPSYPLYLSQSCTVWLVFAELSGLKVQGRGQSPQFLRVACE